ncbi:MAG: AAA family ATPase, partial [Ferruginibacter sp.]
EKVDQLLRDIDEEEALVNAAQSTIADYNERIKRYTGMTNINPGSGIKMDVIKTQLDMENEQLKAIKEKYSQVVGLSKDDPTANFIQTRLGLPAPEPESKKTLIKMALSGMSVFVLTSLIFIFLEVFDSSLKTPSTFNRQTKTKNLSVLNKLDFKKVGPMEVVMEQRDGEKQNKFKNNIRKIRFELLNSNNKSFLVTSTREGVGKSTIIQAIAASLLLSKKKVLILDLNFYNNSLTREFNCGVFIQDVAKKINYSLPLAQQKIVCKTKYDGIDIIGCEQGNYTPSEVLYNLDDRKFINKLEEEYDFILIEGAALNYYADTKELVNFSEGIITVFSALSSFKQIDKEGLKFITDLKNKNNSVILNKVLTENIDS